MWALVHLCWNGSNLEPNVSRSVGPLLVSLLPLLPSLPCPPQSFVSPFRVLVRLPEQGDRDQSQASGESEGSARRHSHRLGNV